MKSTAELWSLGRKVICKIIWLLLIILIIRSCFLDIYRVPSDSMKNTLKTNDYIITNKALYSGIFSKIFLKLNIQGNPKLNDILVFKIAQDDTTFYVKRCVGIQGQTISISNGHVLINNQYINEPASIRHLYKLWYSNFSCVQAILKMSKIDLSNNMIQRFPAYAVIYLDNSQKASISKNSDIDSITNYKFNEQSKEMNTVTDIMKYGNEIQNLSPILIPFAGMKIKLDSITFQLYKGLFLKYENVKVEQKKGIFLIDGVENNLYIFKKDYYFMMGDNRDNSIDSRYFGLIPKECIEGRVVFKI